MKELLCMLMGYAIGTINPAYLIGRLKGFDIRKEGSGNAGASNAVITMGKKVGAFSALFDIFKAFAAVRLADWIFDDVEVAGILAGVCCIIGHVFPILMGFRGGKGLASLGGVILACDWRFFLILLGVELVLVLLTDYICWVPITASVIFPVCYLLGTDDFKGTAIIAVASVVMLCKHIENVRRIVEGKEAHFSLLWNRKREAKRFQTDDPIETRRKKPGK